MMMEVTPRSSYLIGIIRRMQSRSEMLKQNKKKQIAEKFSNVHYENFIRMWRSIQRSKDRKDY